ncbi:MAG: hypothetical protein M3018_11880 [Actinomycetota bacterium]|nr:hypothetical protein [Actinomycetota bacterium]
MRSRRIAAPMIVCLAALACGLVPASASAAPTPPALVGSVSNASNLSGALSIAISGHYAYTTAYWAGQLTVVDISNPTHPAVVGSSPSAPTLMNGVTVTISGGYAYVVSKNRNASATNNDDGTGNALTILDIHTDPTHPSIVGTLHDPIALFGAYGVAVKGNYAFVAAQGCLSGQPCPNPAVGNNFDVIDISTPSNPVLKFTIPNPVNNSLLHADSVSISGNFAYVTASYSHTVTVIDISNPLTPFITARVFDMAKLQFANDVVIQGNYAYVASQVSPAGSLTVLDISKTAPKIVGSVQSPALDQAYRLRVRGNFVYVSSSHADTIAMVDVSNPASPTVAATVHDSAHLHRTTGLDIALTGRYLIASSPALLSESPPIFPPFSMPTGTISAIDLDPSPVSVNITAPGAGAQYKRGQVVHASYACTPGGLISVASCTGPVPSGAAIDTSTPGKHTFTVTGTDQAGQTGRATVTYTVGGPMVTGLRQSARRWREHGPKHAAHRPPLGTTFTITLSQSARLSLTFTQGLPGRMVGGRCVKPTKANRHRHACTRTLIAGKLTRAGSPGANKVRFAGRIKGRFLRPGRYTLAVTATAGGITSARKTITFTIV